MNHAFPLLLTLPLLACASTTKPPVAPESPAPSLQPGPGSELALQQPVQRALGADDSGHDFKLQLGAGLFVRLTVTQPDRDLVVAVHGPGDRPLRRFDSAGKGEGAELVSFAAEQAGVYRIRVEPFAGVTAGPTAHGGDAAGANDRRARYTIELLHIEPLATDAAGRSDQLLGRWNRADAPGLAVAVARGDEIIYQRAYGSASLEHGAALTADSVFQAASVAKQFTAFAIFVLADRGALSLDDDVRKHIPELPDFGATITLRHLLYHQSGLRDQWALMEMAGERWEDRMTPADVLERLRHQQALDFAPGAEFSYSNIGYSVLAEVVARVSGESFAEWTRKNIFAPLGMNRSRFVDDPDTVVGNLADSYSPRGDGFKRETLNQANPGPSSLYTTVGDLARWTANLDSGAVGGRALVNALQNRSVLQGAPMDYAAGLYHGESRGLKYIGHGGAHAAYRAAALRFPEHGLAVLVLANHSGVNATRVAVDLARLHAGVSESPPAAGDDATAGADTGDGDTPQATGQGLSGDSLDAFVGKYKLPSELIVGFERDGDALLVVFQGARIPLARESATVFTMAAMAARITFEPDADGKVDKVTVERAGRPMVGERLPFATPSAAELQRYAGSYYSPELQTLYTVTASADGLVASHRRRGDIALAPADKDAFTSTVWYFGRVVFARDASGAVTEMRVSGTRARNVLFKRTAD